MDTPVVTITAAPAPTSATFLVHVQNSTVTRTFEVPSVRLQDRLVAVLVSEFGMAQADARTLAASEIAAQDARRSANQIAAQKAAGYDQLEAELGNTQASLAKAANDLAQSNAELAAAQKRIAELEAQAAHAAADLVPAPVPPPASPLPAAPAPPSAA